jgi:hypothetical protein
MGTWWRVVLDVHDTSQWLLPEWMLSLSCLKIQPYTLRVALENRLSSNHIQINMPLKLSKKCLRCHCFYPLHAKMLKNADLCIGITHIKLLDLH